MLTNEDKERIYQAELYRIEVQAQLDRANRSKTKKGDKFWAFVNSAVFLWFLSSVVLGIISFSYARRAEKQKLAQEQRERDALIERETTLTTKKLDAEISSRVSYFAQSQDIHLIVGRDVGSSPKSDFGIDARLSEEGIRSLNDTNATDYKTNVYPEYANRNLRSLLLDLKEVVPGEDQAAIDDAHKALLNSQQIFLRTLSIIKERKKSGKPSYVSVDESFGKEEAIKLKKLCVFFNQRKRWGKPVPEIGLSQ